MLLSGVVNHTGAVLVRDGEFDDLGFVAETRIRMLTFVEHPRFIRSMQANSAIAAMLTTAELGRDVPAGCALATSDNPRLAFALIHNQLTQLGFYWRDFDTCVDPDAQVHPTAWIAPKNVRIGPRSKVGPHASILERCTIGQECRIGSGVVLGGVGFQTVRSSEQILEMQHAGGLQLGDRVHVLPGAVIATGLFRQDTCIESDCRIGSQAFVSHNVAVGRGSFVGHGSVVNGNVKIGKRSWIGPGAVIADNLNIGENATVSLGSVVIRDVESDARVSGNFAVKHQQQLRQMAVASSNQNR